MWKHAEDRREGAGKGAPIASSARSILFKGAVLAVMMAFFPPRASGYEVIVSTDLIGQGYQLRDATGRVLNRRRLDAYLRLYVYDILPEPEDPDERRKPHPQMYWASVVRLEADFGSYAGADADDLGVLREEMPSRPAFRVLFGYLGVTGLARGWLELKAGRQFYWDTMDAYQYDGVLATVNTPWYVKLEVFAGSRVNGTLPIDAPILMLDGTSPTESPLRWAPAYGVAVATRRLGFLHARLSYRSTFSVLDEPEEESPIYLRPDQSMPDSLQRWATAEEKLAAWASAELWGRRFMPFAGVAYSILTHKLARALIGFRAKLGDHVFGAEYARHEPTFDGDSIFNIFNTEPFTEARAVYELTVGRFWSGYARASLRIYRGGDPEASTDEERKDLSWQNPGGGVGARYSGQNVWARADWYWQEGYGGRTLGFDAWARHDVGVAGLSWEGRMTIAYWNDDLQESLQGVTAGVALGGSWRFHQRMAVHLLVEENFGEFYKSDLRIYGILQVRWCHQAACGTKWTGF
jgi:hypothetical protein